MRLQLWSTDHNGDPDDVIAEITVTEAQWKAAVYDGAVGGMMIQRLHQAAQQ
jgi:hypothetical protein